MNRFYPEGCRLAGDGGRGGVYLIEQKPCVRTVTLGVDNYIRDPATGEYLTGISTHRVYSINTESFRLAMPFVIFVVSAGALTSVAFSKKSLSNEGDEIYLPLLPNVNDGLGICHGYMRTEVSFDPVQACSNAIAGFWQSTFSYFLNEVIVNDPRVRTFQAWQRASAEDPFFVLEVPWVPFGKLSRLLRASCL